MQTFLRHLKSYFANYVEQHSHNYNRHSAVDRIYLECYEDYLKPNLTYIVKDWLLTYASNWGRQKRTLEYDDRQLEFAGNWFSDFGERRIKLPHALQLSDRKVLMPRTMDRDWQQYLKEALDRNVNRATAQSGRMHRFYEKLLKGIYAENPGIDFEEVIRTAIDRGLLHEVEGQDGAAGAADGGGSQ